ncbi:hypothetical protein GCM10010435_07970 [Winogradskya consettensis]|uniref:Uncharacterized protein n=1 Tax=Winogradskya consettensis TaxID=113560 RepID=A0A919SXD2_9ACTN|nr:hypothetical protein [Actinoplanes consettensis]GIM80431.1 hypothetical protein Aco04nite_70690 [Actinoplanes consettensis]
MTSIATLREKIDLLRAVEAQQRFGTVIGPGAELAPIPALPAGTTEVFSLFGRLEGNYLLFKPPSSIRTPTAWREHTSDNFALGEALVIGAEIFSTPEFRSGENESGEDGMGYGGAPIRMSLADGHVYYIDPENYIFLYKNPDADNVEIEVLAPDLMTFFDRYVLGDQYPRLVEVVIGSQAAEQRHRKTGDHVDSWRRLLIAAGLAA